MDRQHSGGHMEGGVDDRRSFSRFPTQQTLHSQPTSGAVVPPDNTVSIPANTDDQVLQPSQEVLARRGIFTVKNTSRNTRASVQAWCTVQIMKTIPEEFKANRRSNE